MRTESRFIRTGLASRLRVWKQESQVYSQIDLDRENVAYIEQAGKLRSHRKQKAISIHELKIFYKAPPISELSEH